MIRPPHASVKQKAVSITPKLVCMVWCTATAHAQGVESPIRFTFKAIPFQLDNCETPRRHAPETMAGGVAVFDYDNDGDLDIFFTNGAEIAQPQEVGSQVLQPSYLPMTEGRISRT